MSFDEDALDAFAEAAHRAEVARQWAPVAEAVNRAFAERAPAQRAASDQSLRLADAVAAHAAYRARVTAKYGDPGELARRLMGRSR